MNKGSMRKFSRIFAGLIAAFCLTVTGCGSENKTSTSSSSASAGSTSASTVASASETAETSATPVESEVTLHFHYLRTDGDYTDMSVWAWPYEPNAGDGASYDLIDNGDENGAEATITVTDGSTKYGFIIRKNDWSLKDTDGDRFVEIGDIVAGTLDIYCKTGEESFDVKEGNDIVKGVKFVGASADSRTEISYELTMDAGDASVSDFKLTDKKGDEVTIASVTPDSSKPTKGIITTSSEIDYLKDYTLVYNGAMTPVKMPDYYSSEEFENQYTYTGTDLGATYAKEATSFRVWAPTATKLEINIYDNGDGGEATETDEMTSDVNGTWIATVKGDLKNKYYTYNAYFDDGSENKDIVDPYAKSVGVNGARGEILDLKSTNPDGWDSDERQTKDSITENVVYETHVRDFSIAEDSGMTNKGKYLAFTETGTKTSEGVPTGIDHLKDLGVTAVHILPSYDYGSVDETKLDTPQFNWGYDPVNYNAPEGSYSTDPYHGEVRVNEYKQMVESLHKNGIGAVMDVVYNHTYNTDYCFNKLVPGYFYRPDSNGSGCGNDVATERSMVRKFIVDSVSYWASEYHLDGFRFDLMGLIDTDTMNEIRKSLDAIDPKIIIYGEGWTMTTNFTKDGTQGSTQDAAALTPGIAYFSDTIRDGIKGSVFDAADKGYVNGPINDKGTINGVSDVLHGVKYSLVWSPAPSQTMNYASCHDNLTLWDKINSSNAEDDEKTNISRDKLAAAIVFTAEGTPFIQEGDEFLRTKTKEDGTFDSNSYSSSDAVNELDYNRTKTYKSVYNYYKGLIALRKAYPGFSIATKEESKERLNVINTGNDDDIIEFEIKPSDTDKNDIIVIYNPTDKSQKISLPDGKWGVYANGGKAGTTKFETVSGKVTVKKISAAILIKK